MVVEGRRLGVGAAAGHKRFPHSDGTCQLLSPAIYICVSVSEFRALNHQVSDLTALLQLRMRYQMSPLTPHSREHAGRMRVESLFLVYADIRVQ